MPKPVADSGVQRARDSAEGTMQPDERTGGRCPCRASSYPGSPSRPTHSVVVL